MAEDNGMPVVDQSDLDKEFARGLLGKGLRDLLRGPDAIGNPTVAEVLSPPEEVSPEEVASVIPGFKADTASGARFIKFKGRVPEYCLDRGDPNDPDIDPGNVIADGITFYGGPVISIPGVGEQVNIKLLEGDVGTHSLQTGRFEGSLGTDILSALALPPPANISALDAFRNGGAISTVRDPKTGYRPDPGGYSWSDNKKQKTVIWKSRKWKRWNKTELKNGEIDPTILREDAETGARLVAPALQDFLKLNEAYKIKFGKTLKVSGYRTYDSQVNVRMRRAEGDLACRGRPQAGKGEAGSGQLDASCKFVGFAAVPGTSNHGWAAAVDIDRPDSGWTGDHECGSPEFKWLNKYAHTWNYVFGVKNEHWHLDWKEFSKHIEGPVSTTQKSWTACGKSDSIALT